MNKNIALIMGCALLGLALTACQNSGEWQHPSLPDAGRTGLAPWTVRGADKDDIGTGIIEATATTVSVAATFRVRDYGTRPDCFDEHDFLEAWNPATGPACDAPTDLFDHPLFGRSFCHFKILDANGLCLSFNSLLTGPTSPGQYEIRLRFPVGEVLDKTTISLPAPSDYGRIETTGYYQEPGFALHKGQTYTVQITEQVSGCDTSRDGERVRFAATVTVPCCRGIRGNVDGDLQDQIDISDLVALVGHINGTYQLNCQSEADVDGDGDVDSSDFEYLAAYFFSGGPAPVACD